MEIKTAEFITSVADGKDFIKTDKPIIAVAGKSNVGKSSFINMLANKSKLAKTSNTPGRTRLINYFDFGEFVLADLPGYGFASVAKTEKIKWGKLLERFFEETTNLAHVFSLVDIRHDPTKDDIQMITYLYHYSFPFTIIATKADKIGKSKIKPQLAELNKSLTVGIDNIIATSATERRGKEDVLKIIDEVIKRYYE